MSASSNSEVAQLEDIEDQNAPGFSLLLKLTNFANASAENIDRTIVY
jgi:hypothetical protein